MTAARCSYRQESNMDGDVGKSWHTGYGPLWRNEGRINRPQKIWSRAKITPFLDATRSPGGKVSC